MPRSRPSARTRRAAILAVLVASSALGAVRPAAAAPDAELQKKVNAAIERGAAWLLAQRGSEGMYESLVIKDHESYEIGVTCLCGLALLASGESKKDPGMLKMLETVRRADQKLAGTGSRRTYDSSALLMFLTEMYRPEAKPSTERYAHAKVKDPCGLPKDVQTLVQELATWLVSVQMTEGWWRYPNFPPGDLSNTQYALLGLRAARDCGASVPAECFSKALEQTLAQQEKDGPKVRRIIKGGGKAGESDYAVDSGDRSRGWKYQPDAGGVCGSMTTAGIAVARDLPGRALEAGALRRTSTRPVTGRPRDRCRTASPGSTRTGPSTRTLPRARRPGTTTTSTASSARARSRAARRSARTTGTSRGRSTSSASRSRRGSGARARSARPRCRRATFSTRPGLCSS